MTATKPRFEPRARFNSGYHDGAYDRGHSKPRRWDQPGGARHYDRSYAAGYAAGYDDARDGEYRQDSAAAWTRSKESDGNDGSRAVASIRRVVE